VLPISPQEKKKCILIVFARSSSSFVPAPARQSACPPVFHKATEAKGRSISHMVFVVRLFVVVLVYSHWFGGRDRTATGEEREWRLVTIHGVEGIGLYVVSLCYSTCCWSASYPEMSLAGVQVELLLSVHPRSLVLVHPVAHHTRRFRFQATQSIRSYSSSKPRWWVIPAVL
jgi:hypothetical protein